jgi:hypothetical protein
MNHIVKSPLQTLGYNFIAPPFLPEGKDEYYLRNQQATRERTYRHLTPDELVILIGNRNSSDNWNNILVNEVFNPDLIQNCKFYGLVRIGKLEPFLLEFSELKVPVGLYNSLIISCDFGDNVSVDNVNYISHYIVEDEAIILNVNELLVTPHGKFGNGIIKEGESENIRIRLELCNENAGRSVLPFNGMLPGDAWLWSKYRDNEKLMERLLQFTEQLNDRRRGYYGTIGTRTVIKNCKIIKDVCIGSDAYLKGANKIKNVTINSSAKAKSQVGEGCEIVNGIIGYGCRVFYGVKAVRFVMADQSQLKYGARLINSYLGSNATISCCEVLNSLIFPGHEQHHNNSFLCAALIMGQSNIAAGATIGSNHNSRSPDGELIAGRGFWPGLCVSLKHNSKFASYTILAKGDFPAELNIPLPFSLVSNDVANDRLVIMPGYWFMYNMYALARNAWKYIDRDKRIKKIQKIDYEYLAPDTINEMFNSLTLLERYTGKAFRSKESNEILNQDDVLLGRQLLMSQKSIVNELEVEAPDFENTKRKVVIIKPVQAYHLYKELILFYAITTIINWMETENIKDFEEFQEKAPASNDRIEWINNGGQLMPAATVQHLIEAITNGSVNGWNDVHDFYEQQGQQYETDKLIHAIASLEEMSGKKFSAISRQNWVTYIRQTIATKEWMVKNISDSRAKDYNNPFRKMVYDTVEEMNKVMGKFSDNSFILQETKLLQSFKEKMNRMATLFSTELQPA